MCMHVHVASVPNCQIRVYACIAVHSLDCASPQDTVRYTCTCTCLVLPLQLNQSSLLSLGLPPDLILLPHQSPLFHRLHLCHLLPPLHPSHLPLLVVQLQLLLLKEPPALLLSLSVYHPLGWYLCPHNSFLCKIVECIYTMHECTKLMCITTCTYTCMHCSLACIVLTTCRKLLWPWCVYTMY